MLRGACGAQGGSTQGAHSFAVTLFSLLQNGHVNCLASFGCTFLGGGLDDLRLPCAQAGRQRRARAQRALHDAPLHALAGARAPHPRSKRRRTDSHANQRCSALKRHAEKGGQHRTSHMHAACVLIRFGGQ